MAAYSASARIDRPTVREATVLRPRDADDAPWDPAPPVGADERGHMPGTDIDTRLADLRDAWARTTFYLFSPESWR